MDGTCNNLTPPIQVCSVHSVQTSSLKPPTSLVRLVLRYFIFYDAVVKGIVFFISFSDSWLLLNRSKQLLYIDLVSCKIIDFIFSCNRFLVEWCGYWN